MPQMAATFSGANGATSVRISSNPLTQGSRRPIETSPSEKRTWAIEASQKHGKPVLSVSELVASNPENSGPAALRERGRLCYPSAHRAVRALDALVRWSEVRDER